MGRGRYLDTDDKRLPEGFTRIGYDAESAVYSYRDSDGCYWDGAPGNRYGLLKRREVNPELAMCQDDEENNNHADMMDTAASKIEAGDGAIGKAPLVDDRAETRHGIYARLTRYLRHRGRTSSAILVQQDASTMSRSEVVVVDQPEQTNKMQRAVTFDDILAGGDSSHSTRKI